MTVVYIAFFLWPGKFYDCVSLCVVFPQTFCTLYSKKMLEEERHKKSDYFIINNQAVFFFACPFVLRKVLIKSVQKKVVLTSLATFSMSLAAFSLACYISLGIASAVAELYFTKSNLELS